MLESASQLDDGFEDCQAWCRHSHLDSQGVRGLAVTSDTARNIYSQATGLRFHLFLSFERGPSGLNLPVFNTADELLLKTAD